MGHLDVVGVDKAKWTVDPFGGAVKNNYLYGRGTIDDKGMTIANLAALIALKRSGARLNRDVIFLAEGDEENGGEFGMKFAVEKHWDKIACGFAINEDGEVSVANGKVQYVGIQTSEKVAVNVDVIAKGTSGHASVPRKDNPVTHLAAAIAKIGAYETPVQFNSVTRAYFEGLAPIEDEDTSKWMRALETSDRGDHAARWISDANPVWNSMLRDTISPTILQAGIRQNVIPPEARGVLNIRLLPGNMASPLLAKLQTLVNDPASALRSAAERRRNGSFLFAYFRFVQHDFECGEAAVSGRGRRAGDVHQRHRFRAAAAAKRASLRNASVSHHRGRPGSHACRGRAPSRRFVPQRHRFPLRHRQRLRRRKIAKSSARNFPLPHSRSSCRRLRDYGCPTVVGSVRCARPKICNCELRLFKSDARQLL